MVKSQDSLPVRFWGELDQAAIFQHARSKPGNLSAPAFHGVAPEQGTLSRLPAQEGQVLIGQARAFAGSDFAFSTSNVKIADPTIARPVDYLPHALNVLSELPGTEAADKTQAKTERFLQAFETSVHVRLRREGGEFGIPAFKAEEAKSLLNNEFSPAEAKGLLAHFQAFLQSPYGDPNAADKRLLQELQGETENRLQLQSAGQQRIPIVVPEKGASYEIGREPRKGD